MSPWWLREVIFQDQEVLSINILSIEKISRREEALSTQLRKDPLSWLRNFYLTKNWLNLDSIKIFFSDQRYPTSKLIAFHFTKRSNGIPRKLWTDLSNAFWHSLWAGWLLYLFNWIDSQYFFRWLPIWMWCLDNMMDNVRPNYLPTDPRRGSNPQWTWWISRQDLIHSFAHTHTWVFAASFNPFYEPVFGQQ